MHVPENAVLQTIAEREDAIRELTERGLPLYSDRPKNWDNLIALSQLLPKPAAEVKLAPAVVPAAPKEAPAIAPAK